MSDHSHDSHGHDSHAHAGGGHDDHGHGGHGHHEEHWGDYNAEPIPPSTLPTVSGPALLVFGVALFAMILAIGFYSFQVLKRAKPHDAGAGHAAHAEADDPHGASAHDARGAAHEAPHGAHTSEEKSGHEASHP
ncbi:MAG: hypothetical protein HS116_03155 [Planctomycetes bacterium]|nr:hypothetical protein [Planctomycetota bacterium]